ncbi:MAG: S9 family peptidase [Proteobacteria bacterium]|nr:S9 family peptidase [Pseudomonadota bacterium]MDA0992522.1 S9 family peptidase [Pseudomonadota bacterium]
MFKLFTTLAFVVGASSLVNADTFKNTDVFELEIAGDPQISPDGSRVAYTRLSNDIMTDRTRSNIWLVGADGRTHRPLLSGTDSYSSPRWSPGGDRLAYVSSAESRGPELYVRWMDTGQTALLSNLPSSPGDMSWSPDGSLIAFTAHVKSEGPTLAKPPEKPEGAEWAPPVIVIDSLNYRADGRGYLEPGNAHVFVIPAEGGTPRQITSGHFDHDGPLAWSPDGRSIVMSSNRDDDWEFNRRNTELWSVDVDGGEVTRLTNRFGPDDAATFSPDGSKIAYLGYDDKKMGYHNVNVYVMNMADQSVEELTTNFDRSVSAVAWAGSSSRLYIQYDDRGKTHLATLAMDGRVQSFVDDIGSASVSRPYTSGGFSAADNGAYAYSAGAPNRPADIAAGRRGGGATKLTNLNDDLLGHKTLGAVEEITWRSSVGDHDVQGWIVTPPDFDADKQYPLILEIHGGPFTAYGPHFSVENQLYAAAGYVVLYTNPRGSTSYGDEFANEIHYNYPGQDYDDLMSGVDAVISRGYVDEDQLFVTGGSGGGVLSAWIVGKTDRFAAAVVAKPVINWISEALYSDIHTFIPGYWFEKMPWEDPMEYWRRSPLSLVGNVSTPTMLLTGESDHRTPMPESEQYYQALKLRKIDSALVRVPESSHGIATRPSNQIAKVDNILAWFAKYRKE